MRRRNANSRVCAVRRLALAGAALACTGCIGIATSSLPEPPPLVGVSASALAAAPAPRPPHDVLAVTEDMRRFVNDYVSRHADPDRRIRQLTSAVLHPGTLGVTYRDMRTRTAAETFDTANGNCLSLSLLFVALVLQPQPDLPDATPPAPAGMARAELAERPDTITVAWSPSEFDAYSGVSGDVVWNNQEQRGYLRLVGMPANDPAMRQYQLWIVDPERDAEPIDGGVFDVVAAEAEVLIPIDAKLPVLSPSAFAITAEQPGGVVVSEGPLLLVAAT